MYNNKCINCDSSDELTLVGDVYICENCIGDHYVCEDCGEHFFSDENHVYTSKDDFKSVCNSCIDSYDLCDSCGRYHDESTYEGYTRKNSCSHDTQYYCDYCIDELHMYQCNNCETYEFESDGEYDGDNLICRSCLERYSHCENCGCLVHQDEVIWRQDNPYCNDCRGGSEFESPSQSNGEIATTSKVLFTKKQYEYTAPKSVIQYIDDFYSDVSDSVNVNDLKFYKSFDIHKEFPVIMKDNKKIESNLIYILGHQLSGVQHKFASYKFHCVNEKGYIELLDTRNQKAREYKTEGLLADLKSIAEKNSLVIHEKIEQIQQEIKGEDFSILITNDLIKKQEIMTDQYNCFETCQTPDNVTDYSQGYYDLFVNGNNLLAGIYCKGNLIGRMIIRYFEDINNRPILFLERMYTNGKSGNFKDKMVVKIAEAIKDLRINKKKVRIAWSTYSQHDSSWKERLEGSQDIKGYRFDTAGCETLRQPARRLDFHDCAYYRDSYTYSYRVAKYGDDMYDWVYDCVKIGKYAFLNKEVKQKESKPFFNTEYIKRIEREPVTMPSIDHVYAHAMSEAMGSTMLAQVTRTFIFEEAAIADQQLGPNPEWYRINNDFWYIANGLPTVRTHSDNTINLVNDLTGEARLVSRESLYYNTITHDLQGPTAVTYQSSQGTGGNIFTGEAPF